MKYDSNQNALTWGIWAAMFTIFFLIIISTIIISAYFYRKKNKQFLTLKKIIIFSIYLSIFLIQSFIFSPLLKLPIPFSFDSITTIVIGFIYGPLEGILFGWVADTSRVFINGWAYSPLASLMYPMIGIISSIVGIIYREKNEMNKFTSLILSQVIMFIMFVFFIGISLGLMKVIPDGTNNSSNPDSKPINTNTLLIWTISITSTLFIFMELFILFTWFKNSGDLYLISLLLLIVIADRGLELIIRPFTEYFSGRELNYTVSLYTRLLSTTYLVPIVTLTSFVLLKTTNYATKMNKGGII